MKNQNISIQPDAATPMPLNYFVNELRLTSRTTLWRWVKLGLKTTRIGGRVFISQTDLQQFLEDQNEATHAFQTKQ